MASPRSVARLEAWIWILIYGGLFAVVLGIASLASAPGAAWSLIGAGAVVVLAGAVLIVVRARIAEDAVGAQSKPEPRRPDA